MVAVPLMLVDTVLIPAAKTEAINSPVKPDGRPFTMKYGNILSAAAGTARYSGNSSGCAL